MPAPRTPAPPIGPANRPSTGRTRNEQARQDILAATLALARHDLGATTVDSIAARAGVGKQTIYRWWPSKWAVILDALLAHAEREIRTGTDSGPPADRLATFLVSSFDLLTGPDSDGPLLRALMAQAQLDPGFAVAWREKFILPRRRALAQLLNAGAQDDREAAVDLIFGGMWYRLLVEHGPLDEAYARRLSTAALALLTE
ncbi:TetR/AcrR family transcriptional regulator [Paractinoplanes ferrugineus]|uniref:TetR family transcriptional regulator n=1 Tax=Paractinoplanes ferrugineus TaxID=113564 RepID=A0A919IYR8_9ACTN|nr:TetR/AcrR family transcriptional regulator [Actinoplanes ferrugineus]GIE11561.1 TetR family transcriptional regulator [Actinoplanes ferrugineus]